MRLVGRGRRRRARRRGRSCASSSRARRARGLRSSPSQSTAVSAAPGSSSCEPTWTCRPSASGRRRSASSASSGGRPNFEPWWPVRIFSCVSASIPGVTRIRVRPTPASRARSISSSESMTTSAPGRGGRLELVVALVVAVHDEAVAGDARPPGRSADLAERRDVGAEPLLGEEPQERDARERLRPVADERHPARRCGTPAPARGASPRRRREAGCRARARAPMRRSRRSGARRLRCARSTGRDRARAGLCLWIGWLDLGTIP